MKSPITVDTFTEFVEAVELLVEDIELLLFRGQAQQGNLIPRIARADPTINTTSLEKRMLGELRRMGEALLPVGGMNEWGLLVLAQHHGMATRLLDWSENPLTGLWFACSSYEKGDCFVYTLNAGTLLPKFDKDKGPFEQSRTRVVKPTLNNARIVAQYGWFTAHHYSRTAGRFVALDKNSELKDYVGEIRIPESARADMLKSLDRHGISKRTLFPDLDGLCQYISWKLHEST